MNMPLELINHILSFRPIHPTAKLIKQVYDKYMEHECWQVEIIFGTDTTYEEYKQFKEDHPDRFFEYYHDFYYFVLYTHIYDA